RHFRVNTVLIEQIDGIDLESLKGALGDLLDVLWPTVQAQPARLPRGIELEPELGGNHHLLAEGREGFAHQFFVCDRAIPLRRIEECDAAFDGCPENRDHLLLVSGWTVGKAHSHTAQSESRNFQVAISKFALLHFFELLSFN